MTVRVEAEPFEPAAELARFMQAAGSDAGGVTSFVGTVRGSSHGRDIRAMTLEHYPGMTERSLTEIAAEAQRRWPIGEPLIIHRVGRLLPGEPIVLVATASSHREAAFDACRFLIDWLKTKAPFWKLEETDTGDHWVTGRAEDDEAAAGWR